MKIRMSFILVLAFLFMTACAANDASVQEEPDEKSQDNTEEQRQDDAKVVTMEGKVFTEKDLNFYTTMNQLKLLLQINTATDDDTIHFLQEQQTYYENVNVNLQSMIELYAMSLLAEEKNYFVPAEKLQAAVEDLNEEIANVKEATKLVDDYGKEAYNRNIEEYMSQSILRDRIAAELKDELIEEHPNADEKEINYLLEDKFEDLMMDQISSLEMDIHLQ